MTMTNAETQAEIMDALAELKLLADGVQSVQARLLVLYGRLEGPGCAPLTSRAPATSPTVDLMVRELASGFPVDREGFEVRISAGARIPRALVQAALIELLANGQVVEAVSGKRTTVCIPKVGVTLAAPTKPPMTLAIEASVMRGLAVDPVADHAAVVEAVARLHGVGRVMVQFVLTDMVADGRVAVRAGAPGSRSDAESGRLIVL